MMRADSCCECELRVCSKRRLSYGGFIHLNVVSFFRVVVNRFL